MTNNPWSILYPLDEPGTMYALHPNNEITYFKLMGKYGLVQQQCVNWDTYKNKKYHDRYIHLYPRDNYAGWRSTIKKTGE